MRRIYMYVSICHFYMGGNHFKRGRGGEWGYYIATRVFPIRSDFYRNLIFICLLFIVYFPAVTLVLSLIIPYWVMLGLQTNRLNTSLHFV